MHRTYVTPAAVFERTRCAIVRMLIPIVWGLGLLTLRILPPLHPYRIYATDRIRHSREIGLRATRICGPGRLLPAQIPHLVSGYLIVDALSYRVKGPFDLVAAWHLDERVHILSRIGDITQAAPLLAGLLG